MIASPAVAKEGPVEAAYPVSVFTAMFKEAPADSIATMFITRYPQS